MLQYPAQRTPSGTSSKRRNVVPEIAHGSRDRSAARLPPTHCRIPDRDTFDSNQGGGGQIHIPSEAMKGNFSVGPVVKTLCFQCRGVRFKPWLGN